MNEGVFWEQTLKGQKGNLVSVNHQPDVYKVKNTESNNSFLTGWTLQVLEIQGKHLHNLVNSFAKSASYKLLRPWFAYIAVETPVF